jgi:hypothetical protein
VTGIFDAAEFKPYKAQWDARLKELQLRRSYYDGSIYTRYRETLGWMWPRLYKGVKPLYLPLARAVDVDAGIVPGGWSFPEEIPETTRQAWAAARQQLWNWSKWQTRGVLYGIMARSMDSPA